MNRLEVITRTSGPPTGELAPGVELRMLATGSMGARGLSTALARFRPGAVLPYHKHPFSEVVVVLSGTVHLVVEGRQYALGPHDAIHLPAGTPHLVRNVSTANEALLHSSFASDAPSREAVTTDYPEMERAESTPECPETVRRFAAAEVYELAPRAFFRDLFARRFGSRGICGGFGIFEPGAGLPCHYHGYDASITIVMGRATCQVAGREYHLADCDTACIPQGQPHRFVNRTAAPMAMIWVYAGDEPDRTVVDSELCLGVRAAPPAG
jgi:quercetin dioxygenase-like cupin family protein